jgi:hypothetical protein
VLCFLLSSARWLFVCDFLMIVNSNSNSCSCNNNDIFPAIAIYGMRQRPCVLFHAVIAAINLYFYSHSNIHLVCFCYCYCFWCDILEMTINLPILISPFYSFRKTTFSLSPSVSACVLSRNFYRFLKIFTEHGICQRQH